MFFHRLKSEKSSSSSLPYSFYELPGSQHSSSDQSQGDLEHAQYDGAGASRPAIKGAYHSIRLNGYHAPGQPHLDQPEISQIPKSPTPYPTMNERSGLSPLPSHPHSRPPGGQHVFRPSMGLLTSDDVLGAEQDAVTAVRRNISSPLDLVQERATAYMHRISTQIQANQAHNNLRGRQEFRLRRPRDDTQPVPQRMGFEGDDSRRPSVSYAPYRPHSGNHHQSQYGMQLPRYVQGRQVHPQEVTAHRGNAYNARAGQRSSENVPVGTSMQDAPPRPFHVSTRHGGSSDLPLNSPHTDVRNSSRPPGNPAAHLRYSLPHPPRPRDTSNRPFMMQSPPSVMEPNSERSDVVEHVEMEAQNYPTNDPRGPRGQPLLDFRQGDPSAHFGTRRAGPSLRLVTPTRRPSAVPPAYIFHRSLSRGPPSTSTTLDSASGVTSRRPPHSGSATVSSRRLPPQQQDQENSGEAEREQEIMREELAAVGLRYGVNDSRQDRMDETPPRIGRIERRMAD
ncbi:hypothetical protein DM02DRAFT_26280 [Periconia macrospinosa]|uniref:Uncharacterized protein n=1 Tax=Periconia macrospinosa TaxID=97972 RepID=A0A2V1DL77_9PLEO|nr:hypothetical protein DM02DRAFT_26280 [Periconia macrospinosa]